MQTPREGIHGTQIYLRVIAEKDLEMIYQWKNDRELIGMIAASPFPEAEFEVREWYTRNQSDKNQILLGIYGNDETMIKGIARLMYIDWINSNTELGIFIGTHEYRGHGAGTEAVSLLVDYAFNDLRLHRVYLKVGKSNVAAVRSYTKCGFEIEGTLRDHHWLNGKFEDMVMMGITNKLPSLHR